ncbi:unnamed protein product [Peniophora sp. CBMAI 1063]|nr:unnamed protein product [Peniophora sp. CBMAI 1063]
MSRLLQRVAARQRSTLPTATPKICVHLPKVAARTLVSTPTLDEFLWQNLSSDDSSTASTSAWPAEQMRQRMLAMKTRMLLELMSRPNPQMNAVWHAYEDLLAYAGDDVLPLEIHQLALRNSVLSPHEARRVSKSKYLTVHFPDEPLPLENRMRSVLQTIKDGGMVPALEDFHFVLRMYASVGHFAAAEKMLAEVGECGLKPVPATYGYVLQACAHRSRLPSHAKHVATQQLVECVRRLIAVMAERNIPMAPVNVDLAARVLRYGADEEGFAQLVKYAYDFDLAFTDHAPIDVASASTSTAIPASMPRSRLSTAALNMIIDELGRTRRISKMVEAFEVLTNPLPQPSSAEVAGWDEDEDGGYTPMTASAPASAPPNTTSFRLLITHAAKAGHVALARHYILHAMHLETQESRRIRAALRVRPPVALPVQPQVAVHVRMLYPLLHVAVRKHDVGLLRFVRSAALRSIRSKWGDIDVLTEWRAAVEAQEAADRLAPPPPPPAVEEAATFPFEKNESVAEDADVFAPLPTPPRLSTFFTPSSSTPSLRPKPDHITAYEPADRKPLNYALHMLLLQTERSRLDELVVLTSKLYARAQLRIKERLGRRVWRDQDVYVRSVGDRVRVDKNYWRGSVRFWGREEEESKAVHGQRRFGKEGVWKPRERWPEFEDPDALPKLRRRRD